jgi:hypothetical protein
MLKLSMLNITFAAASRCGSGFAKLLAAPAPQLWFSHILNSAVFEIK